MATHRLPTLPSTIRFGAMVTKLAGLMVVALAALALTGCNSGEVSTSDMENVRNEMSREAYEEGMRKAGRGDELEAQKKADAARMSQDNNGGE